MTRPPMHKSPTIDDELALDRVDALPAQFAETLMRLRRTRSRVASIRQSVHGLTSPEGTAQTHADLPVDEGFGP